jgi:hypothetical protein
MPDTTAPSNEELNFRAVLSRGIRLSVIVEMPSFTHPLVLTILSELNGINTREGLAALRQSIKNATTEGWDGEIAEPVETTLNSIVDLYWQTLLVFRGGASLDPIVNQLYESVYSVYSKATAPPRPDEPLHPGPCVIMNRETQGSKRCDNFETAKTEVLLYLGEREEGSFYISPEQGGVLLSIVRGVGVTSSQKLKVEGKEWFQVGEQTFYNNDGAVIPRPAHLPSKDGSR